MVTLDCTEWFLKYCPSPMKMGIAELDLVWIFLALNRAWGSHDYWKSCSYPRGHDPSLNSTSCSTLERRHTCIYRVDISEFKWEFQSHDIHVDLSSGPCCFEQATAVAQWYWNSECDKSHKRLWSQNFWSLHRISRWFEDGGVISRISHCSKVNAASECSFVYQSGA